MHSTSIRIIALWCLAVIPLTTIPSVAQTKPLLYRVPPLKKQLAKVIIPSIQLEQATLEEALQVLVIQIKRESEGGFTPNFIVQDPGADLKQGVITLQLEKIPADMLLQYIVNQVKGKIRYDKYVIAITPR